MKTSNERKACQAELLRQVGRLIEQFRLDTHTTFEILSDDTGMHYHTYRKVSQGDPKQRTLYLLLAMAEMMQRDASSDNKLTQRFFQELCQLLMTFEM
ncbi:MAG: hypothetical protein IJ534_01750 [Bacteroidaceae bacterium]|nr:hypothetical protein [Bacteroidaceae bacterium]